MSLSVRAITGDEHLAFVASRPSASFLQCPAWAEVKREWRGESLGWVDADGKIVGAGLVLYRQVPRLRRFLAYLPEGPLLDWPDIHLRAWLDPMLAHLKARKAFGVRMGPPLITRRWTADTIKRAVSGGQVARLPDLPP